MPCPAVRILGQVGRLLAIVVAISAAAGPVAARDALAINSLMVAPHPGLIIERIEIVLTPATARMTYRIRNTSATAVKALLALPMPDIDRYTFSADTRRPLPADRVNFLQAAVTAAGRPVPLASQQRATVFGLDVTARLAELRLPLAPFEPDLARVIRALPTGDKARLVEQGILVRESNSHLPNWSLHSTIHWIQEFPPATSITIEATQVPLVGVEAATAAALDKAATHECLDRNRAANQRAVASGSEPTITTLALAFATSFWPEPIGQLSLRVEPIEAGTLVSTCYGRLERSGPNSFEITRRDVVEDADVRVAFVH